MKIDGLKKAVLPVKYPIITSIPEVADLLSVIQNYDGNLSWIFNNYIQISMIKDGKHTPTFIPFFEFETCPCVEYMRLSRDLIATKWSNLNDFIIQSIDMGYYIYVWLDQYYIKCSENYQTRNMQHPTLIYGYDLFNSTISIADFYKNGKYEFTSDCYFNIEKAYKSNDDWYDFYHYRYKSYNDVILYKHQDKSHLNFNINLLIKLLVDYLYSRNTHENEIYYKSQLFNRFNRAFGISIYEEIRNRLEIIKSSSMYIPNHFFAIPADHKKLMLERIKYLGDNGYIMDTVQIYKMFEDVLSLTKILQMVSLKYNLTKDIRLINKIISYLPQLVEKEKYSFEHLLSELKKMVQ